jgi:P27 family predicted phage terminase small subunit
MTTRGPAPTPSSLKLLRGNPGRRPVESSTIQPDATPPECPDWLDPVAKDHWASLAPRLVKLGLLTSIDGDSFAAYCQAYAEFREATETLRDEGRDQHTKTGYLSPHPAVARQRSAWAAMKTFAALFGLDPSSRARIQLPGPAEEEDPFDAFLKNRV